MKGRGHDWPRQDTWAYHNQSSLVTKLHPNSSALSLGSISKSPTAPGTQKLCS